MPDFLNRGDVWHGGADLGRADFPFRMVAIHQQPRPAIDALQPGLPFAQQRRHGFGVVHIRLFLQAIPGQRPIHRASIDINVAERLGDELRIGALAAGARAVDGNDDRFIHSLKR